MRAALLVLCLTIAAACSSSTEPSNAGDPSLLVTNNLDNDYVYFTWKDGQGIVGRDSVPPRTAAQCIRFTAQPDSAYWDAHAEEAGAISTTTYPWFNPSDRPAWRVVVSHSSSGSPIILTTLVDTPC